MEDVVHVINVSD